MTKGLPSNQGQIVMVKQINLQHAIVPTGTFLGHLNKLPNAIGFVTEPHYYGQGSIGSGILKMHQLFSYGPKPRSALVVPRQFLPETIPELVDRDWIGVKAIINDKLFLLCSGYMDIKIPIAGSFINRVFSYTQAKGLPLVMCVDSNAHGETWGNQFTNNRGRILEELILQAGAHVHNIGRDPTFQARGFNSIIDLTITLNLNIQSIRDWTVCKHKYGSDHFEVRFYLDEIFQFLPEMVTRISWKKLKSMQLDWPIIHEWSCEILDRMSEYWLKELIDRVKHCSQQVLKERNSWWNDDLEQARKEKKRLFKKWLTSRHEQDHNNYIAMMKKLKKMIRQEKDKSFKLFVDELEDPKTLAKLAKGFPKRNNEAPMLLKHDGSKTSNCEEALELLLDAHLPNHSLPKDRTHQELCDRWNMDQLDPDFSIDRINDAIKVFKRGKTPGPDGVTADMLKNMHGSFTNALRDIVRASTTLVYIPKCFDNATLKFIPKPGKMVNGVKDLRPITMSSNVVKLTERLILWRWERRWGIPHTIHPAQFGFRPGYSTEAACSKLTELVRGAFNRGEYVLTSFLDVKGAFNHLQPESLLNALLSKDRYDITVQYILKYMSARKVTVYYGNHCVVRDANGGCGQGTVSGPTNYSLATEPAIIIFDTWEGGIMTLILFADDISMSVAGFSINYLFCIMNRALEVLNNWFLDNNLTLCPIKSKAILFSQTSEDIDQLQNRLFLGGHPLELVSEFKYLGVVFNSTLTWNPALKAKLDETRNLVFQLKSYTAKSWGLKPKSGKWIYEQIIVPKIMYNCQLWVQNIYETSISNKLNKISRMGMTLITAFFRSTPTKALEVILDVKPLHLRVQELAMKAYLRIKPLIPEEVPMGHLSWIRGLFQSNKVDLDLIDPPFRRVRWNRDFEVNIGDGRPGDVNVKTVEVYTDGSKTDGGSGAGYVVCCNKGLIQAEAVNCHSADSVYIAEIMAILVAAQWVIDNVKKYSSRFAGKSRLIIRSDSQAVLKTLQNPTVTHRLVDRLITVLNVLARHFHVKLYWVKAHAGHKFNELADKKAKQGAQMYGPYPIRRLTHKEAYSWIKESIYANWKDDWQLQTRFRQARTLWPSRQSTQTRILLAYDRETIHKVLQLVTGHNVFNRHLFIMNWYNDPTCRLCGEDEETSFHVLIECPALKWARFAVFGREYLDIPDKNSWKGWKVRELVTFARQIPDFFNMVGRELTNSQYSYSSFRVD